MKETSLTCPFCTKQHNAELHESKFYNYDCEEFGHINISKRAITEFERHPNRIEATKTKAIECKQKQAILKIIYQTTKGGLQTSCVIP